MHRVSGVRHHHLRFTLEAAFEFGRDEQEDRGALLSRHQERGAGQLPQISTVESRVGGGGIGHEVRSQFWRLFFHQLRSSGLREACRNTLFPQIPSMNSRMPSSRSRPQMSSVLADHDCCKPSPTDVGEGAARRAARRERGCARARDGPAPARARRTRRRSSPRDAREPRSAARSALSDRQRACWGIDVGRLRRSVGRGETPAVGDDPVARGERLHLLLKRVQISQAAMDEDNGLSLTAFQVVERCAVDLEASIFESQAVV